MHVKYEIIQRRVCKFMTGKEAQNALRAETLSSSRAIRNLIRKNDAECGTENTQL